MSAGSPRKALSQERIVALIAVALVILFTLTLPGFASPANVLSLLQNVAIIGILALGMAITIIGRGIDLSMIALATMPVAWTLGMVTNGASVEQALASGLFVAIVVGLVNGWLIAYVEIPAIFATLSTGTILYGAILFTAVSQDIVPVPAGFDALARVIRDNSFGIPHSVIAFLGVAGLAALFLRFTVSGRFIYAIGDNPAAARTTGVPVRPNLVLQYVLAAVIALLAGYVLAATVDSANTRLFNSTMIYDVILVVVLGGIGLGGGKGRVSNVLVGTILIGILINGMTMMNIEYTYQNLVKASILLIAIVIDSLLNPRDEQTSQQGDI